MLSNLDIYDIKWETKYFGLIEKNRGYGLTGGYSNKGASTSVKVYEKNF